MFDGSGWCLLAKRLEAGSLQLPPFDDSDTRVGVDGDTFAAIIAGFDFTAARSGAGYLDDLREWNGLVWLQVQPPVMPRPRVIGEFVYDPVRRCPDWVDTV